MSDNEENENETYEQDLMRILLDEPDNASDESESDEDLKTKLKELLNQMRRKRKKRGKDSGRDKKRPRFKVPKDHPMFSGRPEDLDQFIMKMELQYEEYTDSVQREAHLPHFICKLGGHFEKELGADWWFYTWARGKRKRNEPCTWLGLVEAMREQFGGVDQERLRFNEFIDLRQGAMESVTKYMSQKAKLALQCEVSDKIQLYGFIRGLRSDIQSYVNLQRPKSLDEAQKHALTFEASTTNGQKRSTKPNNGESKNGGQNSGGSGTGSGTNNNKSSGTRNVVDKSNASKEKSRSDPKALTQRQKEALEEIRQLRKGKCFACGQTGHESRSCTAPQATKDSHQERISKLKQILRQQ